MGGVSPFFFNKCVQKNLFNKKISDVCTKNPLWISEDATALSAIEKMNAQEISSLLVTKNKDLKKKTKSVKGILHLHHCLNHGLK